MYFWDIFSYNSCSYNCGTLFLISIQELEGRSLATSSQFDTFGFTAAELARKQAEKEHQHRCISKLFNIMWLPVDWIAIQWELIGYSFCLVML